jgi:hypothetical protein
MSIECSGNDDKEHYGINNEYALQRSALSFTQAIQGTTVITTTTTHSLNP